MCSALRRKYYLPFHHDVLFVRLKLPVIPFADHAEGGMLFPEMITKVLPRMVRFDLDFDLPEHLLPDPAPAIFLTTRPDLGDVAKASASQLRGETVFNGKARCASCWASDVIGLM